MKIEYIEGSKAQKDFEEAMKAQLLRSHSVG
jgi:hypothetical protein